jgi:glucokinase-like ROK family protein
LTLFPSKGQPELLKELNRAQAFEILKRDRIISRTALAEQTGLSRATSGILADDLILAGVAVEIGLGDSTGGRRPVLLQFAPDAVGALGALMYDRKWLIVLTNLDGHVIHRREAAIADDAAMTAVRALKEGVDALRLQVDGQRILPAIGVGTPGLVDTNSGVIQSAVDVGWIEVPFRAMVEDELGLKAFIANRSKVGALAELWHGPAQDLQDLVFISIATGVAAGIVCAGTLYFGSNSSAGELGHMTIIPDGPLCPCGNRGCLQQLVSGPALANTARQRLRHLEASMLADLVADRLEMITAHTVFQAAEQGDSVAQAIVDEAATYLGIAIANLINLLNPKMIVLGGPVGHAAGVMLPALHAEVRRRAMVYPLSVVQIVTSTLGLDSGAIGAAVLVLQHAARLLFAP